MFFPPGCMVVAQKQTKFCDHVVQIKVESMHLRRKKRTCSQSGFCRKDKTIMDNIDAFKSLDM